jgi:hypothetical protein
MSVELSPISPDFSIMTLDRRVKWFIEWEGSVLSPETISYLMTDACYLLTDGDNLLDNEDIMQFHKKINVYCHRRWLTLCYGIRLSGSESETLYNAPYPSFQSCTEHDFVVVKNLILTRELHLAALTRNLAAKLFDDNESTGGSLDTEGVSAFGKKLGLLQQYATLVRILNPNDQMAEEGLRNFHREIINDYQNVSDQLFLMRNNLTAGGRSRLALHGYLENPKMASYIKIVDEGIEHWVEAIEIVNKREAWQASQRILSEAEALSQIGDGMSTLIGLLEIVHQPTNFGQLYETLEAIMDLQRDGVVPCPPGDEELGNRYFTLADVYEVARFVEDKIFSPRKNTFKKRRKWITQAVEGPNVVVGQAVCELGEMMRYDKALTDQLSVQVMLAHEAFLKIEWNDMGSMTTADWERFIDAGMYPKIPGMHVFQSRRLFKTYEKYGLRREGDEGSED